MKSSMIDNNDNFSDDFGMNAIPKPSKHRKQTEDDSYHHKKRGDQSFQDEKLGGVNDSSINVKEALAI
jgi:hypothetical protein